MRPRKSVLGLALAAKNRPSTFAQDTTSSHGRCSARAGSCVFDSICGNLRSISASTSSRARVVAAIGPLLRAIEAPGVVAKGAHVSLARPARAGPRHLAGAFFGAGDPATSHAARPAATAAMRSLWTLCALVTAARFDTSRRHVGHVGRCGCANHCVAQSRQSAWPARAAVRRGARAAGRASGVGRPARARGRRAKPQLSTMGSSSQSLQTLQLSASRNRRETSGISLRQSSMGVASICDDEEVVRRRLIAAIVQRCRCSLCASEWSSRRRGSSSDAWRCVRCGRVERRVRARSVSLFARAVHQSGLQNDRPFPVDAAALKGLPAPMEASTTIGAVLQISDLSL